MLQMVSTRLKNAGPSNRQAMTLSLTGWREGQPVWDSNFSDASNGTLSHRVSVGKWSPAPIDDLKPVRTKKRRGSVVYSGVSPRLRD